MTTDEGKSAEVEAKYLTDPRRGGLTPQDRAYLRGEGELTEGSEYNTRRRIRERVHDTVLDFSVLMDRFEENEDLIREAFDASDDRDFEQELAESVALIFCAVTARSPGSSDWGQGHIWPTALFSGRGGHHSLPFLRILETALDRAYRENGIVLKDGELHVETTRLPQLKTIRRDLEEGETLHPKLGALLLQSGQIDAEAFTDLAREELLDDEE